MISRDSLMATLSPRLLLEINLDVHRPEGSWRLRDDVPKHKLAEFRRRSIANTFKEIIFHDPQVLQQWRSSSQAPRESLRCVTQPLPNSAYKKRRRASSMGSMVLGEYQTPLRTGST